MRSHHRAVRGMERREKSEGPYSASSAVKCVVGFDRTRTTILANRSPAGLALRPLAQVMCSDAMSVSGSERYIADPGPFRTVSGLQCIVSLHCARDTPWVHVLRGKLTHDERPHHAKLPPPGATHDPSSRRCIAAISVDLAAQAFPDKPIKLFVPFPPGGPIDTMVRFVAQSLADRGVPSTSCLGCAAARRASWPSARRQPRISQLAVDQARVSLAPPHRARRPAKASTDGRVRTPIGEILQIRC